MRLLDGYRVLDCCDTDGLLAGMLLGHLGAEVILVEPPGGSRARRHAQVEHLVYNRGKRSVTIHTVGELVALADTADVVLHSGSLPTFASMRTPSVAPVPFPVDEIEARNPAAITVSITPFGGQGPKSGWAATDIVVAAASGHAQLTGNADRPPLRCAAPQTFGVACADAAVGALIALTERIRSGRGQRVDISAQHSFSTAALTYPHSTAWGAPTMNRSGGPPTMRGVAQRWDYPASDGAVTIFISFGDAGGPFTNRLAAWMAETDELDADLAAQDYTTFGRNVFMRQEPEALARLRRLYDSIERFTSRRTKADLYREARSRRVALAPINTLDEVLAFDQLEARHFWATLTVGGTATSYRLPGPIARLDGEPLPVLSAAPPADELVLASLLTGESRRSVRPNIHNRDNSDNSDDVVAPFHGLRVLDLSSSVAGPNIGHTLRAFGASVLKVESVHHADLGRTMVPFVDDRPDASAAYTSMNAGKRSITLNLRTDEGRVVLLDLVARADVVVESYPPGTMDRLDLAPDRLFAANPELVLFSTSLLGQDGPCARFPGWGNMASALLGFHACTGWPDRIGVGPVGAYTDGTSHRFATAVLIAVLEHRRRTRAEGLTFEALHVDFSQGEACLHLLGPALLDWQMHGRAYEGIGNDHHHLAPHGIYRARGDDRWIAIAVQDDEQWEALATICECLDVRDLPLPERIRRRRELDERIETYTTRQDPYELADQLQSLGVPAHAVHSGPDFLRDEQLARHGFATTVEHPTAGVMHTPGHPIWMSRTPARFAAAGPLLGEHTVAVLHELGLEERIASLVVAGAIE